MKLGYKLAHAVLGRNVCLEVGYEDAQEIANELQKLDVFQSSEAFQDLVAEVEEGNLAALEKAAKQWDFEQKLKDERKKRWS
jgi:hypothetical protein